MLFFWFSNSTLGWHRFSFWLWCTTFSREGGHLSFLFSSTSYLPIIVECCWTAASNSRSNMVHSAMVAHSEKITLRRKLCRNKNPRIRLFLWEISGNIQWKLGCVFLCSAGGAKRSEPLCSARKAASVWLRAVRSSARANPALSRLLCVTRALAGGSAWTHIRLSTSSRDQTRGACTQSDNKLV